jgi:hypothetical protein
MRVEKRSRFRPNSFSKCTQRGQEVILYRPAKQVETDGPKTELHLVLHLQGRVKAKAAQVGDNDP